MVVDALDRRRRSQNVRAFRKQRGTSLKAMRAIVLEIAVALVALIIGEECKMRASNRILLTISCTVIAGILFDR